MAILKRLKDLWRRIQIHRLWRPITDGLTLQELWTQFRSEAGASYRQHTWEIERGLPDEPGWKRRLKLAGALFWAMLMRLPPARRVFLLLVLLLVIAGGRDRDPVRVLLGAMGLFLLLALELADRVAMKRDLEIARDIQRWLLPQSPPSIPGVEIAFITRPANTVAGDFYDAFTRPVSGGAEPARRLLLVVVADVAGKGVPAALLMATFQASLRTLAETGLPLVELVTRLNLYSCQYSLEGRCFTTALLAELDPATGALTYVNAGHNRPVLSRETGETVRLEAGGLPLGIRPDAAYESGSLVLASGDRLVIFTDGVVEAENRQGEDYGEARLLGLLREMGDVEALEGLGRVMTSVETFVGGARQQDDVTCLLMRYGGPVPPDY